MTADGLTFFYGNYTHPKGECYPAAISIQPVRTKDNVQWAYRALVQVKGSFVNQSPELDAEGVNTRIAELEQVYRNDYQDFGFNLPDGTRSEHYLLNDDGYNLSGNRVVSRSWDSTYGAVELANTRSFTITLEALILRPYSNLVYFSETTTRTGDGGPEWRLHNQWNGPPVKEIIHNQSKVYHKQEGVIIGLYTWPTPTAPWWPSEEKTWQQIVRQTTPLYHGHPDARYTHYRTDYAYFFERVGASSQTPSLWNF